MFDSNSLGAPFWSETLIYFRQDPRILEMTGQKKYPDLFRSIKMV